MTVEELTAIIAGLTREEVLVLVEALRARLAVGDGPDDWGGAAAAYGGPPRAEWGSTYYLPHVVDLRAVGRFRELLIARVRVALSVSMAQAKAVVDSAPCEIGRFANYGEAETAAVALRGVGADVEVRVVVE